MTRSRSDPPRRDGYRRQQDVSVDATTEAAASMSFFDTGLPPSVPSTDREITVSMRNGATFVNPIDKDQCFNAAHGGSGYKTEVILEVDGEEVEVKNFCFATTTTAERTFRLSKAGIGEHDVRFIIRGKNSGKVNDTLEGTVEITPRDDGDNDNGDGGGDDGDNGGGGDGEAPSDCGEGEVWVPTEGKCRSEGEVNFWDRLNRQERLVLMGATGLGAIALLNRNGGGR